MEFNLQMLRMPRVLEKTGFGSPLAVYRLIKVGLWTKPVHVTPRTSSWPEHEVDALCKARIAELGKAEIAALVDRLHAQRAAFKKESAKLQEGDYCLGTAYTRGKLRFSPLLTPNHPQTNGGKQ